MCVSDSIQEIVHGATNHRQNYSAFLSRLVSHDPLRNGIKTDDFSHSLFLLHPSKFYNRECYLDSFRCYCV